MLERICFFAFSLLYISAFVNLYLQMHRECSCLVVTWGRDSYYTWPSRLGRAPGKTGV